MTHGPCSLIGHADLTLDFFRGDSIPGSGHQEDHIQPRGKRGFGLVEYGPGTRTDLIPAMLTRVNLAVFDPVELGFTRAIGAMVQMPKAAGKDVIQCNTLVGKSLLELEKGEFWRGHFKDRSVGATTIMYAPSLTPRVNISP